MGASSRSPSPITMVPRMGTVSMVWRIALGRDLVGELAVALAHGAGRRDGGVLHHAQELERQIAFQVFTEAFCLGFGTGIGCQRGPPKKDDKKAPSGAVVDYTANRRKKGAVVRVLPGCLFPDCGLAPGGYTPLPLCVCKI